MLLMLYNKLYYLMPGQKVYFLIKYIKLIYIF